MKPWNSARIGNAVYEARIAAGFANPRDAARWLGIHWRTLYRQEVGQARPAGPVLRALGLLAGWPATVSANWQGWALRSDGLLHGPGLRRALMPGEILALPYLHAQCAALRNKVAQLEAEKRLLTAANEPENGGLAPGK